MATSFSVCEQEIIEHIKENEFSTKQFDKQNKENATAELINSDGSIQQRLEKLDLKLSQRKSIQSLIRDGILKEDEIITNDNDRRDMYRRMSNHSLTQFLCQRPTLNELVDANMVKDVMTWTKMEYNDGIIPYKRNCHKTCIHNNDNDLYLIGGYNTGSDTIDLLRFDINANKWFRPLMSGQIPKQRYSHSVENINNNLIMFGGFSNDKWSNDLYSVNIQHTNHTNVWYQPQTTGTAPTHRASHASAVVNDKMYIFGGNNGTQIFNDLYCLDTINMKWTKMEPKGHVPSARSNHSMTAIGNKYLIVFGGNNQCKAFNDIHIFDIIKNKWFTPKTSHQSNNDQSMVPSARCGHNAVCIKNDKLLIFGGGYNGKILNDLYMFDMQTNQWIRPADIGMIPTQRTGASMSVTTNGDMIYIFGGGGTNEQSLLNDLYVLDTRYFTTDHQQISQLIYAAKPNHMYTNTKHENNKTQLSMSNHDKLIGDDIINVTKEINDMISSIQNGIQEKIQQFKQKEDAYVMILRSIEAERKKLSDDIEKDVAKIKFSVKESMHKLQQKCIAKMMGYHGTCLNMQQQHDVPQNKSVQSEIKSNEDELENKNNLVTIATDLLIQPQPQKNDTEIHCDSLKKQIADAQQQMAAKYEYQCQKYSKETQITAVKKTKRGRRRRRRKRKRNLNQQNIVHNNQLGPQPYQTYQPPPHQQYQQYAPYLQYQQYVQHLQYTQPQISPYVNPFQFQTNQHMILNHNAINYANNLYQANIC